MTEDERRAFLEERRTGIGGSDIAALDPETGSPYASPWSIWADKVGLTPPRDEPTDAMQLGLDLEPLIADWFRRRTDLRVAGAQSLVRHRRAPWAMAHLDGYVYEAGAPNDDRDPDPDDAIGVLEAKFTGDGWDEPPAHYRAQVQWQLHCSGLQTGWIAAMQFPFGRPRFEVYEIAADAAEQARLHDIAERFWTEHVETGIAPPADASSATERAIAAVYGHRATVKAPTLELDAHRQLVEEYAAFKADAAAAAKLADRRANELRALLGQMGADGEIEDEVAVPSDATIDGALAVSWRAQRRTDLDAAAVRAEHGDRYDRTSTTRVLRLHGRYLP